MPRELFTTPLGLAACLLAATLCVAPWLFGGVLVEHQLLLLASIFPIVALLCLATLFGPKPSSVPASFVWLLLAGLFGAAQLVPLSTDLGETIAPTSREWWIAAAPNTNAQNSAAMFPISVYPSQTRRNLAMLAIPVVVVAVAACLMTSPEFVCGFMGVIAFNGALFALFGIIQWLTFNDQLYWSVPLEQGGIPFAAFVNRNHAGAYLNLCFAAAIGFLIWVRDRRRSRLNFFDQFEHRHQIQAAYLLASICAAGVICTLSRGAVLAFACAAGVVMLMVPALRNNKTVRAGILTTSVVGLGVAFMLGGGSALSERFEGIGQEQLTNEMSRLHHWKDVSAAIPDYWQAGAGLGTYRFAYRPYETQYIPGWFEHAENQYFEALVEGGVVGLALLLVVLLITWRAALGAVRDHGSSAAMGLGAACLFAVGAQTVHAAFDFNLYMPAVAALFAFLVAASWKFRAGTAMGSFGLMSMLALIACLVWTGWSIRDANHAAKLDTILAEVDRIERMGPVNKSLASRYAEKLRAAIWKSNDAQAHLQYSGLLVDQFRNAMVEELTSDATIAADEEFFWNSTSPAMLNARYFELKRSGRSFDIVTQSEPAQQFLLPAFEAAVSAASSAPVLPSGHMNIAQLSPLAGFDELQTKHADIALRLWPFDAGNLFAVGLLDIQADRTDLGHERWQKSLEVSSQFADEIVQTSLVRLSEREFVDKIMPRNPARAVQIVKRYFADERLVEIRPILGNYLQSLDGSQLNSAERDYFEATSLDLVGRKDSAAEALRRAVNQEPTRVSWRFELAQWLAQLGDYRGARKHARVCLQMAPKNRAFAQFLVSIEREQASRKN